MKASLVGISLKPEHYNQILLQKPDIGWVEIHSENYFAFGGYNFQTLKKIRQHYPISIHGIGMSLGSTDGLDKKHLQQVKYLINEIEPFMVSEHLSWSTIGGTHLPDLMPIPYNDESLEIFATNLSNAQDYLNRKILIENPSSYFEYNNSTYTEPEFLNKVTKTTGAKILLDVNNIYVSCINNESNCYKYIDDIDHSLVKEIHIAGHSVKSINQHQLYIDSHDDYVAGEVWKLYEYTIKKCKNIPTLLEWDQNIPSLDILVNEAKRAKKYLYDKNINCKRYKYA